eukprot:365903-Chlamydomonas_euryale.AAC.3
MRSTPDALDARYARHQIRSTTDALDNRYARHQIHGGEDGWTIELARCFRGEGLARSTPRLHVAGSCCGCAASASFPLRPVQCICLFPFEPCPVHPPVLL